MKEKISRDIRDWWENIKEGQLVLFEPYENLILRNTENNQPDNDYEYDGMIATEEEERIGIMGIPFQVPMLQPELLNINKNFKLWTLYTAFPITHNLISQLNHVIWIESISILNGYRLRIGVAPLFRDKDVLLNIEKVITQFYNKKLTNPLNLVYSKESGIN